jgi:hypothetical protein
MQTLRFRQLVRGWRGWDCPECGDHVRGPACACGHKLIDDIRDKAVLARGGRI